MSYGGQAEVDRLHRLGHPSDQEIADERAIAAHERADHIDQPDPACPVCRYYHIEKRGHV